MPIVTISGGFDPVHIGHIKLIEHAASYGEVVVILNTDEWLERKKGFIFMPWEHRKEILLALRSVASVVVAKDSDGTVCESLKYLKPDFFANGGDRNQQNTPEQCICEQLNINMLWSIGGAKIASSSEMINAVR